MLVCVRYPLFRKESRRNYQNAGVLKLRKIKRVLREKSVLRDQSRRARKKDIYVFVRKLFGKVYV